MDVRIEKGWKNALAQEFEKEYFHRLTDFVREEYRKYTCYPPGNRIFAAFDHCPLDKLKVVVIGQDPYHGRGQANGLCFSVYDGVPHPPSLVNIFKEMSEDTGNPYPQSGDLSRWAEQGVLLLNATLTVRAGQAGSHQHKGWEEFTDAVIRYISENKENVVFLLWGGYAKRKGMHIHTGKHKVLTSGHPSPLSANKGYWFGNKHFTKANAYLTSVSQQPVDWR